MEIGLSTASYFTKRMNEDALLDIGAHGVSICEIFLNSFCEYEPEYIELLKSRVEEAGLRVFSLHPMGTQFEPQLFSIHPRQSGDAWKIYEKVLKACKRLGADHYVMHGPINIAGVNKNFGLDRILPILRNIMEMAEGYGVTLTLENVSWCLCNQPDYARLLDERLDGKLHFTLDVKQAIRAGCSPLSFIDAIGERIVNVHLCDACLLPEGKYRLMMPGRGEVDFREIREALMKKGYSGPAFIEVYSDMYQNVQELYDSLGLMRKAFSD